MRPTPLRLLVVVAACAALLAVAASGVFAAADLSACSLVASEGTVPNPLGTILEGVDATGGRAWAVGGHVVGPVSSPFIQRWDGKVWAEQKLQVPPGPIGISSFYAVKAFSPSDVWAVGSWMGDLPLVEHFDGHAWSLVTVPDFGGSENILTGIDGHWLDRSVARGAAPVRRPATVGWCCTAARRGSRSLRRPTLRCCTTSRCSMAGPSSRDGGSSPTVSPLR